MSVTTEAIKARLNIVEVVGQYVRLQKAGNHWKANCPFHQEKTPSFTVSEERNMWHCFGCGKGGDVFAFLMEIEGIEFREALTLLAERAGVELPQYSPMNQEKIERKGRSLEILEWTTRFYEKQLWESERGKKILEYLHGRGLSDTSIRLFRLGYAPDGWRYLMDFLLKKGFAPTELEQAGLIIRKANNHAPSQPPIPSSQSPNTHYDRFRDRIMFPIGDILGRTIGYSARVAPGGDESQAKYINTPETDVYHKSRVLYGLHLAKKGMKERGRAVLVEGNVDVIALHQAEITETVAVSGTALTVEQLTVIKRYVSKIALFFDMDAAGQKAAWRSTVLAQELGLVVEVVALEHGKDAADMGQRDPQGLKQVVARGVPAMEYFLNQLLTLYNHATPEDKRAIVTSYAELLASVMNTLDRAHWTKFLAERIGSEPKIIQASVEQVLQSLAHRSVGVDSNATTPFLPKAFTTRSEMLREAIIGLMLLERDVSATVLNQLTPAAREFFSLHPLFFFLQNEHEDSVGTMESEALQKEASRLLFQTLALPDLARLDTEAERAIRARDIAQEYLALLPDALAQDRRRSLAQALEAARKAGDRAEEKRLLAAFAQETKGE